MAREPAVDSAGRGIRITLAVAGELRDKEESDIAGTLKEVLTGDEESGQQGLIPRNIFKAMVDLDLLGLIFFSLVLEAALSVLGKRAASTLEVISTLNDAVMQLVHLRLVLRMDNS